MIMAERKTSFFEIVKLLLRRRKKIHEEEQKSDPEMSPCVSTEKYFLQKTNSLPQNAQYSDSVSDIKLKSRSHSVKKESHQYEYNKRKYQSLKIRPSSSQIIHNKTDEEEKQLKCNKKQTGSRKLSIKRVTSIKKYKASKLNQSLPNINEQVFDVPNTGEARTISSSLYKVDSVDVNTMKMFPHSDSILDKNIEIEMSFE